MTDLADVAARKAARHVLPIIVICYFLSYLDRSNVSFAGLKMAGDLGLSPEAFGFALGIFFIGYFIFEIPSNLIMEKVGARIWIARIMVTWGLLSAATAFAWNATSLYGFRFVLGVAEAGFFPGIILYLTYWFPQDVRARMIGRFMVAIPISNAIGGPLSGLILEHLNGFWGLKGWQWVFVIEGLPTCLLGLVVWFVLVDGPKKAPWLTKEESDALSQKLEEERRRCENIRHFTLREALSSPRVLALSFIYFGVVTALYGVNLWLPKIIYGFGGLSPVQTGLLTALPAVLGAIAIVLWTRHSDVTGERNWHVALPAFVGGAALIVSALLPTSTQIMIALTVTCIAMYCVVTTFWMLPTSLLTGTAAAGGIALINSLGNLGGTAGSNILGLSQGWTKSYSLGMVVLGLLSCATGATVLYLARRPVESRAPQVAAGVGH